MSSLWARAVRIAGLSAAGAVVVIWLAPATLTRLAADPAPSAQRQTAAPQPPPPPAPAESAPPTAALGAGAAGLRERLRAAPRPVETARNPFRLPPPPAPPAPAAAAGFRDSAAGDRPGDPVRRLDFTLIGIAVTETADGPQRTAVLVQGSEVRLARPGEALGGGWSLDTVGEDNVRFRHVSGATRRVALP